MKGESTGKVKVETVEKLLQEVARALSAEKLLQASRGESVHVEIGIVEAKVAALLADIDADRQLANSAKLSELKSQTN